MAHSSSCICIENYYKQNLLEIFETQQSNIGFAEDGSIFLFIFYFHVFHVSYLLLQGWIKFRQ